ncbi:uncharacterized protein [Engystomops pustulosus]|uniref:uncharacterized protein isoform X1 n=1 Tax=Engystomops pustulosus TaxID=76066 RepID=UPI003AFAAD3C
MVPDHIQPLDSGHNKARVQARINISSSPKVYPDQAGVSKIDCFNFSGSPETHSDGCNYTCSRRKVDGRSLLPLVPHPKAKWIPQDDLQPQRFEPASLVQEVQDGVNKVCSNTDPSRSLHVHDRPKGRILPRPYLPSVSKVFEVCNSLTTGEETMLPIQVSTFRDSISAKSVFKNHHRGRSLLKNTSSPGRSISGRLTHNSEKSRRTYSTPRLYNPNATESRMDYKLGEVCLASGYSDPFPGNPPGLCEPKILSSQRKVRTPGRSDQRFSPSPEMLDKRCYEAPGAVNILHPVCPVGTEPYESPARLDTSIMGQRSPTSGQLHQHYSCGQTVLSVVDHSYTPTEGSSMASLAPIYSPDGCKSKGLGCEHRRILLPGKLASSYPKNVIQLSRTEGSPGNPEDSQSSSGGTTRKSPIGQLNDNSLPTASRGYKISRPFRPLERNILMGRIEHQVLIGSSSEREGQQGGRFSEQEKTRPQRMVSEPKSIPASNPEVGNTCSGSVCHQGKYESGTFLLSQLFRDHLEVRCIQPQVERSSGICLSSSAYNCKSSPENSKRRIQGHSHCSLLAQKELVSAPKEDGSSRTSNATHSGRSPPSRAAFSSEATGSQALGLDPERSFLRAKGLSDKILEFLQAGFDMGLKTSTLKVQIAALSVFFDSSLADHRWIKRFVKATVRIRPSVKPSVAPWDLSLVLNFLTGPQFEPIESVSLRNLTLKTAFLIAITTARRIGEIQALSINEPYCLISDDRIILTLDPNFVPKVCTAFHRNQEVVLPSFCQNPRAAKEISWHSLDVRRIVLRYMEVSKSWRKDSNILLQFQGKNKGKKASKSSLSRWIKTVIKEAYEALRMAVPDTIKAHSTRAMATSWAERRGATIEQICKAATWSSSLTFAKHYRLDIPNNMDLSFGRKILQAVVPP